MPKSSQKLDPISVLGEILVTLGVIALLFAFWDVYWTNLQSAREQNSVAQDLENEWGDNRNPRPLSEPLEGTAFARISIPSFGSDFNFSIVRGVSDADLEKGPGHYMDTQDPGKPGNFALAGHRVGRGAPFNDLGKLNTCDSIVVETAGSWFVYRVLPMSGGEQERRDQLRRCMDEELANRMATGAYTSVLGRHITVPSDVSVINPVPSLERTAPEDGDAPILTLTTCHPQFSNKERMIIHAVQVREDSKKPGYVPKELTQLT